MNDDRWFMRPRLSRRDAHLIEAALLALAAVLFVVAFLASPVPAKILRVGAAFEVGCAYLASSFIRVVDTHKLWPAPPGVSQAPRARQRWRSRAAELAFALGVGTLATVIICWVAL